MANTQKIIESFVRKPADFPYDGVVTEVFADSVHVRPVGSRTIKRNVKLPEHIDADSLYPGLPVKMNEVQGKPAIVSVFFDASLVDYSGKGSVIPDAPTLQKQTNLDKLTTKSTFFHFK